MNKKRNIKPGTGIATILLIFVVLAMTIMAALSYVRTWQDDQSLQREYAYKQAYYKADAKAKYICDEIMQLKDVEEISTQNQVDIQFEKNIYSFLEVQMDQDGNILEWMTKTKEEM